MDENLMTAEGLEALTAEIHRLETESRDAIAAEINTARQWGDLKENGEYHAAKEAQGMLEGRIASLKGRLATARVVEVVTGEEVSFGSTVEIEDEQSGKRSTLALVSSLDATPAQGSISLESPMAHALLGRKAGDTAVLQTPKGERHLKVISVS